MNFLNLPKSYHLISYTGFFFNEISIPQQSILSEQNHKTTYQLHHSSDYNIYRVNDEHPFYKEQNILLKSNFINDENNQNRILNRRFFESRTFTISIAFDHMTQQNFNDMQILFKQNNQGELIFDETPYKGYNVICQGLNNITFLCFTEEGENIYKGEGTIDFISYEPYAHLTFLQKSYYRMDPNIKLSPNNGFEEYYQYQLNQIRKNVFYCNLIEWNIDSHVHIYCILLEENDIRSRTIQNYWVNFNGKENFLSSMLYTSDIILKNTDTSDKVDMIKIRGETKAFSDEDEQKLINSHPTYYHEILTLESLNFQKIKQININLYKKMIKITYNDNKIQYLNNIFIYISQDIKSFEVECYYNNTLKKTYPFKIIDEKIQCRIY